MLLSLLHFSTLTKVQISLIANGCGSKSGFIPIPQFIFNASCDQHDFYYWRGGTEQDRLKADNEFYQAMKDDIKDLNINFIKKQWYRFWAYSYYKAVRFFGRKHFCYRETQKTLEDLVVFLATEQKKKQEVVI